MHNSRNNRVLCGTLLLQYCKLLEVRDIPKLIFYKKEIEQIPVEERGRITYKRLDGQYFSESNIVYVNLSNHRTRAQLEDTIIHELVHKISDNELPHGIMFDSVIYLIKSLLS